MMHSPQQREPTCDPCKMLDCARLYRSKGLSVIPMDGKRPAIKWAEYQRRIASDAELRSWFQGGRKYNIGIVTGQVSGGIVVVDLDDQEAISAWSQIGTETNLVAMTGGGGMHLFYRSEQTIGNRVRALKASIDIRAEHAVIVVEPSIHPATLQPYRFATPIEDIELTDLPVFDPAWVAVPAAQPGPTQKATLNGVTRIRDIDAYVRSIPAIAHQGGHNAAFRVANLLVHEARLDEEEAISAMTAWSNECANPPFSDREIQHKVRDAIRVGKSPFLR